MKYLIFLLALTGATSAMTDKPGNTRHLVAEDNCGVRGKQPHLVEGETHRFKTKPGIPKAVLSCSFGEQVVYVFEGMDIQATTRNSGCENFAQGYNPFAAFSTNADDHIFADHLTPPCGVGQRMGITSRI